MFTGTLNIVFDLETALLASQASKVMYIGELNPAIPATFITASILLPPYPAIVAEIDGDVNSYNQIYTQHLLFDKNCYDMLAVMLVALYNGIHITIYIEDPTGDTMHGKFIFDFLATFYGIIPGSPQTIFAYNPTFNVRNASILLSYLDGFISIESFVCDFVTDVNQLIDTESLPYNKAMVKVCAALGITGLQRNIQLLKITEYLNKKNAARAVSGPLVTFD